MRRVELNPNAMGRDSAAPFARLARLLRLARFLWVAVGMAAALGACSQNASDKTLEPGRMLFQDAQLLEDQGLYTEAIEKFKKVSTENQGTRLGAYAYLHLADLYSKQEDWLQAETNYRLFLSANSNSHLNAYVLYRLLKVNDQMAYTGLFFRSREVDRDDEPNRQIITEYKRFYLLYPQSIYIPEVAPIYRAARRTLAQHEILVADFYMRHDQYNAASTRYLYALRNYPELEDPEYALQQLIKAYRKDQQPGRAAEMQRVYDQFYGKPSRAAPEQLSAGR